MKRNTIIRTAQKTALLCLLLFVVSSMALPCYAQFEDTRPLAELPNNELPSDVTYREHLSLRAGEPGGPGGPGGPSTGGEGGNEWTGSGEIPLGDGLIVLTVASASYILFIAYRKRRQEKQSA